MTNTEPKFESEIFEKIFTDAGLTAADVKLPAKPPEDPKAVQVRKFVRHLREEDKNTQLTAQSVWDQKVAVDIRKK
jgi:hypothetical protein